MKFRIGTAVLSFALMYMPIYAFAHVTGTSYEAVVSGHKIDIGYHPTAPAAGDRLVLDFSLEDSSSGAAKDFDDVWVRTEMNGVLLVATGVAKASYGPTTLLLRLPPETGGKMTISARFEKGDTALAETSFDIPIASVKTQPWLIPGLLGLLAGAFMMWIFTRKKVISLSRG